MKKLLALIFAPGLLLLAFGIVIAGHNGAVVDYEVGACGETEFTATIVDPDGTHKVSNMYLVVDTEDEDEEFENIPTDGSEVSITVGPFDEDTTVYWNVFGGGERSYDQPLWSGFGDPDFASDIGDYADEVGGFSWVIAGTDDPNPFVNWNEVEVDGCVPVSDGGKLTGGAEDVSAGSTTFGLTANALKTGKGVVKGNLQYTREGQSVPDLAMHAKVECYGVLEDGSVATAAGPAQAQNDPTGIVGPNDWFYVAVLEDGTGMGDRVRVRLVSEGVAMMHCENPNLESSFPGFVNEGNFQIRP